MKLTGRRALKSTLSGAILVAAGGLSLAAYPAMAAKPAAVSSARPNYTKPFVAVAEPFEKQLAAVKIRPDIVAGQAKVNAAIQFANTTTTTATRAVANAKIDTAVAELGQLIGPQRGVLEQLIAVVSNADEKLYSGQMSLQLGTVVYDANLQKRGLQTMVDSGKLPAADVPRINYYLGTTATQLKDYAAASTAFQAAVNGGFYENNAEYLLADAAFLAGQPANGFAALQKAIDRNKAAGTPVSEQFFIRALNGALANKNVDQAALFGSQLVQALPSKEHWEMAITVVRDLGNFAVSEEIDIMRLMQRTASWSQKPQFFIYLQSVDPRRQPNETLAVIKAGTDMQLLKDSDPAVAEAKTSANLRIAADRAILVTIEKDAWLPTADGKSISNVGDSLLDYGKVKPAVELYKLALTKKDSDKERVKTRLGIAQLDDGDFASADASFASVTGARKPLAMLWQAYAKQKAAGK
jgi:tetratricopeptide (TPR) repeat protein